jgi:hypothetical protein
VYFRGLFAARKFQRFRTVVKRLAATAKPTDDGAFENAVMDEFVDLLVESPKAKVESTVRRLRGCAWVQFVLAWGLLATIAVVSREVLGDSIVTGDAAADPKMHYTFDCPAACSAVPPTTPPTLQPSPLPTAFPSLRPTEAPTVVSATVTPTLSPTFAYETPINQLSCTAPAENSGLFWALVVATWMNILGSIFFLRFVYHIDKTGGGRHDTLMEYVAGDKRNIHFVIFLTKVMGTKYTVGLFQEHLELMMSALLPKFHALDKRFDAIDEAVSSGERDADDPVIWANLVDKNATMDAELRDLKKDLDKGHADADIDVDSIRLFQDRMRGLERMQTNAEVALVALAPTEEVVIGDITFV